MNSNVIEISLTNIKEVQDILTKQNLENIDLTNRIDKAIEYIEKSMNNPQPFYEYIIGDENGNVQNLDKLLDILRGEDNEKH